MSRIHLISGPRNISTALMYAFGSRPDCSIVDEPFYAYYLMGHPELDHPGRREILASQSAEFEEVLENIVFGAYPTRHVFIKNMAHHLDKADWSFLEDLKNILLIRNPRQLIASFARVIEQPTLLDIGIEQEYRLMRYMLDNDMAFEVLDSSDLLQAPEPMLQKLCAALDIVFDPSMLKWEKGSRKEDGVWAKYWYGNVHKSEGFVQRPMSNHPFPSHLEDLLEEAMVYYNKIYEFKIN